MSNQPLPPVPQALREFLKDYPEHIQTLQDDLIRLVSDPPYDFERALWTLEDALDVFVGDAQEEVNAAEAAGDSETLARAEKKLLLMHRASSGLIRMLSEDFLVYFQFHFPSFEEPAK